MSTQNYRDLRIVLELAEENVLNIYDAKDNDLHDERTSQVIACDWLRQVLIIVEREGEDTIDIECPKKYRRPYDA